MCVKTGNYTIVLRSESVMESLHWICIALFFGLCFGADPFANFELELSYITASPLGVPQQVPFFSFFFLSEYDFFTVIIYPFVMGCV